MNRLLNTSSMHGVHVAVPTDCAFRAAPAGPGSRIRLISESVSLGSPAGLDNGGGIGFDDDSRPRPRRSPGLKSSRADMHCGVLVIPPPPNSRVCHRGRRIAGGSVPACAGAISASPTAWVRADRPLPPPPPSTMALVGHPRRNRSVGDAAVLERRLHIRCRDRRNRHYQRRVRCPGNAGGGLPHRLGCGLAVHTLGVAISARPSALPAYPEPLPAPAAKSIPVKLGASTACLFQQAADRPGPCRRLTIRPAKRVDEAPSSIPRASAHQRRRAGRQRRRNSTGCSSVTS